MNDTVNRKGVDEEEFLRQMRLDAVEKYKAELVELIKEQLGVLKVESTRDKTTNRETGVMRGMTNVKATIQSHVIKVK